MMFYTDLEDNNFDDKAISCYIRNIDDVVNFLILHGVVFIVSLLVL